MKIKNSWAYLDDGTEILSVQYSGLSLAPDGALCSGFDNQLYGNRIDDGERLLTPEERREIAKFMVDQWEKWGGMDRCSRPPPGWWCSREQGHEGPCAAREVVDE